MNDDFYVGYFAISPNRIARITAAAACTIALTALSAGILLAVRQPQFASSRFEFGELRDYTGTLQTWPSPMLLTADSRYLLVAPGKHGLAADDALTGRKIKLRGSLIERNADRMLEVQPTSIHVDAAEGSREPAPARVDSGEVRLAGEIVDSKCYLGVMNPGEGKVHRGCAARCIAGGVPPMFVARDAGGEIRTVLLVGTAREPLGPRLAAFVAEPVEVSGRLFRSRSGLVLETEASRIRRRRSGRE